MRCPVSGRRSLLEGFDSRSPRASQSPLTASEPTLRDSDRLCPGIASWLSCLRIQRCSAVVFGSTPRHHSDGARPTRLALAVLPAAVLLVGRAANAQQSTRTLRLWVRVGHPSYLTRLPQNATGLTGCR